MLTEDNTTAEIPAGVIARIGGIAGRAGTVNKNRRLYPQEEYERAARAFLEQTDAMLGELDHPEHATSSLSKTAMNIKGLSMVGNLLLFSADVLDTPAGRVLKTLIDSGIPVNVSTRGDGGLIACCSAHMRDLYAEKHAGIAGSHEPYSIVDGYRLVGIDAVAHGAHQGAAITQMEGTDLPKLTEEAPEAHETPNTDLATRLQSATDDLSVLQAASKAEREALESALSEAQANVAALKAQYEIDLANLQAEGARVTSERDEAVSSLNKIKVEEQTNALLGNLRPDVRAKIAEQLSACTTPEEVTERWKGIETLLTGAGFEMAPAGAGRAANLEPQPQLTPEQRVQRGLLGL